MFAFWIITWFWSIWATMSFFVLTGRGIFVQEFSSIRKRREISCKLTPLLWSWEYKGLVKHLIFSTENWRRCTSQEFTSSQIQYCALEEERWINQVPSSPNDGMSISSNTGKQQNNRWRANSIRVSHVWQQDERDSARHRWMHSIGSRRRWTNIYSRNLSLHRIQFMWMMNEIPILFEKDRRKVHRYFCNTRKEMQLNTTASIPDTSLHWYRFSKDLAIWEVLRRPRRTTWHWQDNLRMCMVYRSIQSCKDVSISRKECWRKIVKTCISTPVRHFL